MAAQKVKLSKAGSVTKAVKSRVKPALSRAATPARKGTPAKKAVSSPAKVVKLPASAAKPAAKPAVKSKSPAVKPVSKPAAKAKVPVAKPSAKAKSASKSKSAAVKAPSITKAVPAKASGSVNAAKTASVSRPAAAVKGKAQAKAPTVATPKAVKKRKSASAPVAAVPVGSVHETASTISTGGQQATRSFSVIMQGHAAIAKGIEARKAAAKAKNLARFPRPVTSRTTTTRKLTPSQSKTYEQMLLRLRDELSRQIAFLRGASLTRSDEVNPEEDGSDAFERQLALKLASNEGDAIFEIDEALQRIKDGAYAICQDCGCIINSARLKALPFVRRCVECKRVAEKKRTADDRRYF